jgi:hypothetical protein
MLYSQPQANSADDWEQPHPSLPFASTGDDREPHTGDKATELEPGWHAVNSLMQFGNDDLLAVMLRSSFRPVRDEDLVPVSRCPYCLDGGLRMAGTVRMRTGRAAVRACDTCAAVEIGDRARPRRVVHG